MPCDGPKSKVCTRRRARSQVPKSNASFVVVGLRDSVSPLGDGDG